MELEQARMMAENLIAGLRPTCERMEIAGSIRRGKPEVKDIEIVAIPLMKAPVPVFGERKVFKTLLDRTLFNLERDSAIEPVKGGQKYKQFWIMKYRVHTMKVDLFLVTPPAQWGVIDVIRTGPAEFSQWMVTQRSKGGALPDGYVVKDGAVWGSQLDAFLTMSEEKDFFGFCGLPWMEPKDRQPKWVPA